MKNVKDYQHAFEWAEAERKRLGCNAEPINIIGPDYTPPPDNDKFYSLFYNGRGIALFRTDFPDGCVHYIRITNFEEFRFKAYSVAKELLQNGLELCAMRERSDKWLQAIQYHKEVIL